MLKWMPHSVAFRPSALSFHSSLFNRSYAVDETSSKKPTPIILGEGDMKEEFTFAILNRWITEGRWHSRKNRPIFFQKRDAEKAKVYQYYYAMVAHKPPTFRWPLWRATWAIIFGIFPLAFFYIYNRIYVNIVPEENRLLYKHDKLGSKHH